MIDSYITKYKGKPLYLAKYNEYVEMYKNNTLYDNAMYIITDKKNALIDTDGKIIGYTFDGHKRLMPVQGVKKHWKDAFDYKEEVVISQRPTTEALKTTGEKKLEEVVAASAQTIENLTGVGEEALAQVAKAGENALAAQVANTEVVVKRITSRSRNRKNRVREGL